MVKSLVYIKIEMHKGKAIHLSITSPTIIILTPYISAHWFVAFWLLCSYAYSCEWWEIVTLHLIMSNRKHHFLLLLFSKRLGLYFKEHHHSGWITGRGVERCHWQRVKRLACLQFINTALVDLGFEHTKPHGRCWNGLEKPHRVFVVDLGGIWTCNQVWLELSGFDD